MNSYFMGRNLYIVCCIISVLVELDQKMHRERIKLLQAYGINDIA